MDTVIDGDEAGPDETPIDFDGDGTLDVNDDDETELTEFRLVRFFVLDDNPLYSLYNCQLPSGRYASKQRGTDHGSHIRIYKGL